MKKKVLFVDDEALFITLLSKLLIDTGYESEECCFPKQALKLLEDNLYYCIVVDYSMPDMNGIELAKIIRSNNNEQIAKTPILLLTGWEELEIIDSAKKAGIDLFKQKNNISDNPHSIKELIETTVDMNAIHLATNTLSLVLKAG